MGNPLQTLHKSLLDNNYDVPEDYNSFERTLTAKGDEGYQNRFQLWKSLRDNNYDVPDNYDDFRDTLFTARQPEPSTYKPTAREMAGFQQTIGQATQAGQGATAAYDRRASNLQKRQGLRAPQRVTLGESNNLVEGEQHLNPETGELEQSYITSAGNEYQNKTIADQEQRQIDQDMRDERYRKSLPGQLDDAYAERDRLNAELAQHQGQWVDQDGRVHYGNRGDDESVAALEAALRQNQQRITALEAERDDDGGTQFWRGFVDAAMNPSVQTFGLTDFNDTVQLMRVKQKIDQAHDAGQEPELSFAEQKLIESTFLNNDAQQKYGENRGFMYRAGGISMQALPFVAEFMTTGGFSALSEAGAKYGAKAAEKLALDGLSKMFVKNLGVLAGDVAAGWAMANTTGAFRTASDIMQRNMGEVTINPEGQYDFGSYDEEGNFTRGGKSLGRSIYEAEVANTLEYYTEKLGEHLQLGKWIAKGAEKMGLSKLSKAVNYLSSSKWLESGGIQDYPSEVVEEQANLLLNAMLVGDNNLSLGPIKALSNDVLGTGFKVDRNSKEYKESVFNGKTQGDIWGGMMFSIGLMQAPRLAYTGKSAINYYQAKKTVDMADTNASIVFGEDNWASVKQQIDDCDNEQMGDMIASIATGDMNSTEKTAALNYAGDLLKMRGYNMGMMADAKDEQSSMSEEAIVSQSIDQSYGQGYNAQEPDDMKMIVDDAQASGEMLSSFGEEFSKMVMDGQEEPVQTMNYLMQNRDLYTDEQIAAAADYLQKQAAANGVMDAALDNVDIQVEQANAQIRGNAHQESGNLVMAKMGDLDYYVVGGEITPEGALVGTGGAVLLKDPVTGEISVQSPANVMIYEMTPVDELIQQNETVLRQQLTQQADDDINFGSPANEVFDMEDTVTLNDGNGGIIEGQVVQLPNAVDGVFVIQTNDGRALQMTADDMNRRIVAHNGAEVERTVAQPVQQPDNNVPENIPNQGENVPNLTENVPNQGENVPNQDENVPQSALSRIPVKTDASGQPVKGKNGKPVLEWHKATVEDAASALIETAGGDMLTARDTASDLVNVARGKLEKIRKQKPKGEDPIEIAESRQAIKQQEQEQQAIIKQWQDVNQDIQRRMQAEAAERQAAIEAAKSEEQRQREAEEARKLKEQQEEQDRKRLREQIEKDKERRNKQYDPLVQARREMADDAEALSVLEDIEPRSLDEYVSSLLRPHSMLWQDASDSERGLQTELGLKRSDMQRMMTLLGTKESGAKPFGQVVLDIHEGLPQGMKDMYTDEDVRNTLLDLFNEGSSTRMLHLTEEHRIEEARQMKEENQRRAEDAEMDAWAEAYHLTPEEREAFEAYMQEPPTLVEQEVINQIIADNEQNRTSPAVGEEPVSGAVPAGIEGSQSQVQTAAEAEGGRNIEEGLAQGEEAASNQPSVSDDDVSGTVRDRESLAILFDQIGASPVLAERMSDYDVEQLTALVEDWEIANDEYGQVIERNKDALKSKSKDTREAAQKAIDEAQEQANAVFVPIEEYVEGLNVKYGIESEEPFEGAIPTPEIDNPRYEANRQALIDAYKSGDPAAITQAAQAIQQYVDEGLDAGEDKTEMFDIAEDYNGNDPEKLADQYIIRTFWGRYLDDDADPEYIKTGIKQSEQLKPTDMRDAVRVESPEIGVSEANARAKALSNDEAQAFMKRMEDAAVEDPQISLTPETWANTFGLNNSLDTPVGAVKMGDGQYKKFFDKNRSAEFGMAVQTLQDPDIVLVEPSQAKEGQVTERPYSYVFVKTFVRDGQKMKYYASVTVQRDNMEVSVSSHIMKPAKVLERLTTLESIYTKQALLSNSSDGHLAEQQDAVPDLLPTQENNASFESKGTENISNNQENLGKTSSVEEISSEEAQVDTNEKTGADGEVSTHSDATQANPTFSREDLGAVLSDAKVRNILGSDVKKDENLSELKKRPLLWEGSAIITPSTDAASATVPTRDAQQSGEQSGSASDQGNALSESKDTNNFGNNQENLGKTSSAEEISSEEAKVDTNPSEGQKEAGNYQKGHIKIDGYDITIENPKGSIRRGTDASGNPWETEMHNTYGYIRGTEGVDGDHIDVFLSDNPTSGSVFVVDQVNGDGSFDESKVMYGFASEEEARQAYLSNYSEGWQGLGEITEVSREDFKKWVQSSHRKTKPFAEYKSVKAATKSQPAAKKTEKKPKEHKRIVSDDQMEELRKKLLEKFNQANAGIDVERMLIGAMYAVGKIERGVTKFADYAAQMVDEIGDAIRPYLKSFYNAVRDMPEAAPYRDQMDDAQTVEAFDVFNFDKGGKVPDAITKAGQVVKQQKAKKQIKKIMQEQPSLFDDMFADSSKEETKPAQPEMPALDKNDYRTYMTPAAREYFAKDPRFANYAHKELAFIQAAVWDEVIIPVEELKKEPAIIEAEARINAKKGNLQLTEDEVSQYSERLFDKEHGSASYRYGELLGYTGEVKAEKKAFIVVGRPAGGKSSVFADPISHKYSARIIDSDTVKPWLDGYDDGYGASYVHKASTIVAEHALDMAIERGENVVIPRIGGLSVVERAIELRKKGYDVELLFNDVPEEASIMRAASRFAMKGRYLSLDYLTTIGDKVSIIFSNFVDGNIGDYERIKDEVQRLLGRSERLPGNSASTREGLRELRTDVPAREGSTNKDVQELVGDGQLRSPEKQLVVNDGSPIFTHAEWKDNNVPFGTKPVTLWNSNDETFEDFLTREHDDARNLQKVGEENRRGSDEVSSGKSSFSRSADGSGLESDLQERGNERQGDTGVSGSNEAISGSTAGQLRPVQGLTQHQPEQDRAERSGLEHSVETPVAPNDGREVRDTSGGPSATSTDGFSRDAVSALPKHNNRHNNVGERGKDYAPLSPKARFNANVEAIKMMRELMEQGVEAPTKDQMEVLRQYSGWGGLGTYFNDDTLAENKTLRDLLTEEEYHDAALSIKTAYYTPATVIDTLWDIAKAMGFKGGNVLEGSAGIGNIIGQMPKDMSRRSDIEAVELDPISGNILKLLYPDAKVNIQGFQDTTIRNGSVDLAITNVPFAADISVIDKVDKDLSRKFRKLHDFCIAKNIRKLKEGGIGIFITTSGTLDKSTQLREWITDEGQSDVIGAFRLNNKTFGGTPVTSDIIVVRKRIAGKSSENGIDIAKASPLRVGTWTDKYGDDHQVSMTINDYFKQHPEMMAGEMAFAYEKGETYRPGSYGLYPVEGKDQDKMLKKFVKRMQEVGASVTQQRTEQPTKPEQEPNQLTAVKEGRMLVDDKGRLCVSQYGEAVPLSLNDTKVKGYTKKQCFEDYQAVQKAVDDVLQQQLNDPDDTALQPKLDVLNKAFDQFVKRYGNLHKNTAISFLRNDIDFPSFQALENYSETKDMKGKVTVTTSKTPLFRQRVLGFKTEPQPKTVKDALVASVFRSNGIDLDWIAEKLGKDREEVRKGIIVSRLGFEDPSTGQLEISYKYLSGNVREKLAIAEAYNTDGRYNGNIEELRKVIPMDIPAHLIDFSLGSSWIPVEMYKDYLKENYDLNNVKLAHVEGSWVLDPQYSSIRNEKNRSAGVYSEQFRETIYGHQLVAAALNNRPVKVAKQVSEGYGSSKTTKTIVDQKATQACSVRVDEIKDDFKQWAKKKMQEDPELSQRIEKIYNDKFNALVPMEISDEFLPDTFENANVNIHLYGHQKRGVMRGVTAPTMLAHEVGTGKSFTLITTAMEMRRLGTAQKPMIVVQNATVAQMTADAKLLYPNAKILSLSEKDRSAEGRRAFYAKIKYNDWDLIIVPQSTFERIPDSPERELQFIQEKIDEKKHVIEAAEAAGMDDQELKRLKRELEKYEQEYGDKYLDEGEALAAQKKKKKDAKKEATSLDKAETRAKEQLDRAVDDVQYFDDMGVDALLVDEAHEYKHLGFQTSIGRGIKGVDPSYSKKCAGLYNKTRSVFEKAGWKNVVFATGTPISNTAAEIWTFMKYLMPADVMRANDIYYFDDFVHNFGSIQQMLEFTTSGKFKENTRFAAYVNKPELIRIWSQVADTVLTKEVGAVNAKIPDEEGGKDQDKFLPQSPSLISIMAAVRKELERFENMSGQEKKENSHIPLTMYGIAKRAAIDPRLVNRDAPDEPLSKTNAAVKEIVQDLKDTESYKGTVAVFCDNQNRKNEAGFVDFNIFEDMRDKLIAQGVPAEQIVIIKSGMSIAAKQKVFDAVNSGSIRVVLGSTQTLGTGVNMQERLHLLIHMDAPDRPMDYTQRNGRIKRQGNLHKQWGKTIRVIRFGVEDSLDVTAYQRLKTKSGFIDSIMDGKTALANNQVDRTVEEEEEGLFDNPVAVLSGSQYALKKNQAERELRKYQGKKAQHEADQVYVTNTLRYNKAAIEGTQSDIAKEQKQLERIKSMFPDGKVKTITVDGVKVDMTKDSGYGRLSEVIKEKINDPVNAIVKRNRENQIYNDETLTYTIELDGHPVNFRVDVTRTSEWDGGKMRNVIHKYTTYSSPDLQISNIINISEGVRDHLDEILEQVVTGNDYQDRITAMQQRIERMEKENEQLQKRVGIDFPYEKELKEAEKRVDEYTELMKKELEEKEAKYASQQTESVDLSSAEDNEEDEDLRFSADEDEDPIYSDAFKNWFGDWENDPGNASKVVDENGMPLVLFHATNLTMVNHSEPFWSFYEYSHFGTPGQAMHRLGKTPEKMDIDLRAAQLGVTPMKMELTKTYAVYLNIRNPKRVEDVPEDWDETHSEWWGMQIYQAVREGYDGIVYENKYEDPSHPADSWIAFSPEQIKSATDNIGTYDSTRKDIRYREQERFEDGQLFPIHTTFRQSSYNVLGGSRNYSIDLMPDEYTSEQSLLDAVRNQSPEYFATIEDGSVKMESWSNVMKEAAVARQRASQKSAKNFIERKTRNAIDAVNYLAERMNLNVEVLTTTEGLTGKKARAKGWFNSKTGKITLVLPNHSNQSDLINTLLHEGVAHFGLRKMFGADFNTFLDNVYNNVSPEIKARIDAAIKRNGWSRHEATEEYLARLAERTDFEHAAGSGWWQKIKDFFFEMLGKAGFNTSLTDNELRYILWRSYDNLLHPDSRRNIFDKAREVQMQSRLRVGPYSERERQRIQRTGRIDTSRVATVADNATKEADDMGLLMRDDSAWDDVAKESYEKEVATKSLQWQESWQDSMASLKAIQDAIAKESGHVATGAEDAYRYENRMHGRAKNMTEQYDWRFYRPMLKAFSDFCKAKGLTHERGMDYLIAKSGLERNVYYAFRDAVKSKLSEDIKEMREKLEKDYSKNRIDEKEYKSKKADIDLLEQTGVDDRMQQVRGSDDYLQAKEDYAKGDISYNDYLTRIEDIIRRETDDKYDEYLKDYSGLTETFNKEMYDAAQQIKKQAQRTIDPQERRELWGEYDAMMKQAYEQAREEAEKRVFDAESDDVLRHHTELWKRINAATEETLKHSYESGLMDRNTYNKVRKMFDFYLPLRGWDENKASDVYTYMGRENVFSPAVKKTWGRTSKAEDPLAYIGNIAVSTILSGHRNMMKQHFLNYVMNNPTSLVSISESWYENIGTEDDHPVWVLRSADTAGKDPDEIAQIVSDFNEEMRLKQNEGKAIPVRGRLRLDVNATQGQKAEHVVEVQRAGRTYQLYINGNPKAAQALNGSTARAVSRISDTYLGRKLTALNRSMAAFFTSKNPAFVVSNLSRDLNMAGASVAINEGADYNARFIANVVKVLSPRVALGDVGKIGIAGLIGKGRGVTGLMPKLMSKWKEGKLDAHDETERLFKEFMDEGGETGFVNMLSVESFKEKMRKEIAQMNGSSLFGSKGEVKEFAVTKALRMLGDTFEFYNRCAEDATRFIVYMTSRQMGKTLEQSIADAKDVTLNFNRKGTGDMGNAEVRDLFIFVNPAIQALANMYRMAKGHPLKFGIVTAGFVVAGAMIPVINQWLLNMFGDDDDKDAYWNLPPWVRKNNLVFWVPGTKNFVTMPLAQEFRVFYGVGEMISSGVMDHPLHNAGLEVVSSVADLVPINPTGNGGNLLVDFAPTGVQPIVQIGENVDFTGKPIWKDNQGNKFDPMFSKAYVSTPKWMVKISEGINSVTGGDQDIRGWLERNTAGAYLNNPAVWNHLLQGYFGGMYNTIAKTFDVAVTVGSGEAPKVYQTPILNRFLNRPVERDNAGVLGEEYWKQVEDAEETMHNIRKKRQRAADGDAEAQQELEELLQTPDGKKAETVLHYKSIIDVLRKGERSATEKADKQLMKESISNYAQQMHDELMAIDGGLEPLDAAMQQFEKAKTIAEKKKLQKRIEKLMTGGNSRTGSASQDVDKAKQFVEDSDAEAPGADNYLNLATAEDIKDDGRIKAAKALAKPYLQHYKELNDAGKTEEASQYRQEHQQWFVLDAILKQQTRLMNQNKKLLGKGHDAAIMKLISNNRNAMLRAIDNNK